MKNTIFFTFIFILLSSASSIGALEIRIMSFNIWVGGGKSLEATQNVIASSGADIIGIQESTKDDVNNAVAIARNLGWHSYSNASSTTIISKYAITDTTAHGYGVKIKLDENRSVWMFNIHLMYCPYEPYQLNGIEYCGGPLLSTAEEAVASAWKTRGEEVETIIKDLLSAQKDGVPIFLTGDFNEPSCLDWTARAAKAGLHKTEVKWPATRAFMEKAGMKDSYRSLFPDEVKYPGYTWTPLPETKEYKEVLDRIDFVLYWGKSLNPVSSKIVGEKSKWSNIGFKDYPSDHRSVISAFKF